MLSLVRVELLIKWSSKSILKGTKMNERFRSSENVEKAELDEKKI